MLSKLLSKCKAEIVVILILNLRNNISGKEQVRQTEKVALKHYTLPYVKQIFSGKLQCNTGG